MDKNIIDMRRVILSNSLEDIKDEIRRVRGNYNEQIYQLYKNMLLFILQNTKYKIYLFGGLFHFEYTCNIKMNSCRLIIKVYDQTNSTKCIIDCICKHKSYILKQFDRRKNCFYICKSYNY